MIYPCSQRSMQTVLHAQEIFYHAQIERVDQAILNGITLRIHAGEFVALCGPSGSGKSTLLNVLGLLDSPSSGEFELAGVKVGIASERIRTQLRAKYLSFVFQAFHLAPEKTVLENVELGLMCQGVDRATRQARALEAVIDVGLFERQSARPATLSGGEQQRTAVARALVRRSRVILADEPTGNLDEGNAQGIVSLLSSATKQGSAVVMVTHDEALATKADRVLRIDRGHLVEAPS